MCAGLFFAFTGAPVAAAGAPEIESTAAITGASAQNQGMSGLGPAGTATMHGDAQSSDTTPHPGPGNRGLSVVHKTKFAACPTILMDSTGMVWTLCTKIVGRAPVAEILDPATGDTLASLDIEKGALLGGVYAYLDDHDRLVLVNGKNELLKISKHHNPDGTWGLAAQQRIDVSHFVNSGGSQDDGVVGLTPDTQGNIWLATREGKVGIVPAEADGSRIPEIEHVNFPNGERVDNSISASQQGVAIATSHALYLLDSETDQKSGAVTPRIAWRNSYDRGSARKPGQLSWGSGATPSFFGPAGNDEYVTITDNADGQSNLLVFKSTDGSLVCKQGIFGTSGSGTENSAIAYSDSVIVASTYGYPYPTVPEGAGPSNPPLAPFVGGMEKIQVKANGEGCEKQWDKPIASSAVPRLSTADNTIYTMERPSFHGITGLGFDAITIDANTGNVTSRTRIAETPLQDSLQMVGTISPDGVWWQGTISGVVRMLSLIHI